MTLVDLDVIGSKPTQGIFDFAHDPIAAGVAKNFAVSPFKSGLRGDCHTGTQATFGDGFADDLFGTAETIYRRRIDDIDAVLKRGADCGNRLGFIGSTPHPATNSPGANRDARNPQRCAGDSGKLHIAMTITVTS